MDMVRKFALIPVINSRFPIFELSFHFRTWRTHLQAASAWYLEESHVCRRIVCLVDNIEVDLRACDSLSELAPIQGASLPCFHNSRVIFASPAPIRSPDF